MLKERIKTLCTCLLLTAVMTTAISLPDTTSVSAATATANIDFSSLNEQIAQGKVAKVTTKTITAKADFATSSPYIENWASVSPISDFFDYNGNYTIAYDGGEGTSNNVYITRFNADLSVQKTLTIKKRYPIFGGVICDDAGNYYIAWGQNDTAGKGGIKTFAISKYTYDGTYAAECATQPSATSSGDRSWSTREPFHSGNCAMTIQNGILVCTYAKKMYNGHQANSVLCVNTGTMKRSFDYDSYCSHSFDQRVISLRNGGVLFADHGDAYPRGFMLTVGAADNAAFSPSGFVPFHFYGPNGENYTNAKLGGIGEVDAGYVLVGSSAKSMKSDMDCAPQQLFLQIIDRNTQQPISSVGTTRTGTSKGTATTDTGVKWLTSYTSGAFVGACNMAVIDNDRIFVAWEKWNKSKQYVNTYYMILSDSGEILQKATSITGIRLTKDEELKYRNGYIYWTTSEEGTKTTAVHRLEIGALSERSIANAAVTLSKTSYTYNGKARKPTVTVRYAGTKLTKGTDYTVSYSSNTKIGSATVTVTGKGKYSGKKKVTFKITPGNVSGIVFSKVSSGNKISWKKVSQASGYQILRFSTTDFFTGTSKTFTTTKTSYTDKSPKKNCYNLYAIRSYKIVNGKKIYGPYSSYYG